ncbi:hypothetical protein DRN73_02545 [Candidatus Pacearchaeota archaeon]|nr:MAG: hypothetical protein DRN73_02545 [Candidatus Pacearchaeota archaeon]
MSLLSKISGATTTLQPVSSIKPNQTPLTPQRQTENIAEVSQGTRDLTPVKNLMYTFKEGVPYVKENPLLGTNIDEYA